MRTAKLILGILSGKSMHDRRDRCRRTWLSVDYDRSQIIPVFLIGDPTIPEPIWGGDCLWLPVDDDYPSLPQKTRAFCRWCLDNFNFQAIWKGDDDSYAVLGRLSQYVDDWRPKGTIGEYIGLNVCDRGGPPFASGGAGYFLDAQAAITVAQSVTERTGLEDRLVAEHLRRAGIELIEEPLLRGWADPQNWPTVDNQIMSCHGVRDDATMNRIHAGMGGQTPDEPEVPLFQTTHVTVGYHELGVNGRLGFSVDGTDMVTPPNDGTLWTQYQMLSAHAPSKIEFDLDRPAAVLGFMDSHASPDLRRPVSFQVDGQEIASLPGCRAPRHRTREILLDRGHHVLECTTDRRNQRRYSVWAIREIGTDGMQIVMPTYNRFAKQGGPADVSLQLLERYWPTHPPITVVRHEVPVETEVVCNQYDAGAQGNCTWCQRLERYLMTITDELVTLILDDYGLCGPVKEDRFEQAIEIMRGDPSVGAFYLTWMAVHKHQGGKQPCEHEGCYAYPPWDYTIHTQAGIWRRLSLLRLLRHVNHDIWQFELRGSKHVNQNLHRIENFIAFDIPDPPKTANPMFLDGNDKAEWVIPYHNLMHQGKIDERHAEFLKREGLTLVVPS